MSSTGFMWYKDRVNYSYKGKKNKTNFPQQFVEIVKMTQSKLKQYLITELQKYYKPTDVFVGDGYVYAYGEEKVVLTAHMDTVHRDPVKDFYVLKRKDGTHVISSPQGIGGDDRCGVYMILNILQTTNHRPHIIFCEDEEIGGVGSAKFTKEKHLFDLLTDVKFFIELDRANANDLVFYEDINLEFHAWCEDVTGYVESVGSFSDISHFCPAIGISGVNISCGYYNAHTLDEYVVLEEMEAAIKATVKLMNAADEVKQFEYVEEKYDRYFDASYGYASAGEYDVTMDFMYMDETTGEEQIEYVTGESKYSCIAQFLIDHPYLSWNEVLDWHVW